MQRHVALNITRHCNQRCIFCFEGTRETWQEPDLAQVEQLLVQAARTRDAVIFMGAEALLRKDIVQILKLCTVHGLTPEIFTNGARLREPGFIEQLVEAGLRKMQMSFHYADADSFARGTRTAARNFERLLEGMARLRDHNVRQPDAAIDLNVETNLFALNAGRLAAIGDLAAQALGATFASHRIGSVQPAPGERRESMLAPLRVHREEVPDYIAAVHGRRRVDLAKIPLCLAPHWEHLSMDAAYIIDNTDVVSNFAEKAHLAPMHEFAADYEANPFRWVCHGCNLLAICCTNRTSWLEQGFAPDRDQVPVLVQDRTIEDVVARMQRVPVPTPQRIAALRVAAAAIPVVESEALAALRACTDPALRILDVHVGHGPLLTVEFVTASGRAALHMAPVDLHRAGPLQYLMHSIELRFTDGTTLPLPVRIEILKQIAIHPVAMFSPGPRLNPVIDAVDGRVTQTLWQLFGPRLWPGQALLPGWTTMQVQVRHGGVLLTARGADGGEQDLLLTTEEALQRQGVGGRRFEMQRSESLCFCVVAARRPAKAQAAASAALLAGIAELLRRAGDLVPSAATGPHSVFAAPQPSGQRDAGAGHTPRHAGRSAPLRVAFQDKRSRLADVRFDVTQVRAGDRYLRRVGHTGIVHVRGAQIDGDSRTLQWIDLAGKIVALAAIAVGRPPQAAHCDVWQAALDRELARAGLSDRFTCQVAIMGGGSVPQPR